MNHNETEDQNVLDQAQKERLSTTMYLRGVASAIRALSPNISLADDIDKAVSSIKNLYTSLTKENARLASLLADIRDLSASRAVPLEAQAHSGIHIPTTATLFIIVQDVQDSRTMQMTSKGEVVAYLDCVFAEIYAAKCGEGWKVEEVKAHLSLHPLCSPVYALSEKVEA